MSFYSIILIIVGLGSLALFVRVERQAIDPVMPFAMWKNPVILYANLVSLTTGVILIGISSYLPTFVTGVMEQPAIIAGFTLTAMSIGWPIASSVAGHLLIRYGTFLVSFVGGLSLIVGTTLFVMMGAGSGPWWAAMASFFVGVGMGLTSTSFIVTIQGRGSKRNARIRDGCEYVHAEFWKHGWGSIFRCNFKWHVNGPFQAGRFGL